LRFGGRGELVLSSFKISIQTWRSANEHESRPEIRVWCRGKGSKSLSSFKSELRLGVLGKDMIQDLKLGFGIGWGRKDV